MPTRPSRPSIMDSPSAQRAVLGAGAVLAAAGAAIFFARCRPDDRTDALVSDAPPWTFKDRPSGDKGELIGRSQTINRPRDEIYRRWREYCSSYRKAAQF